MNKEGYVIVLLEDDGSRPVQGPFMSKNKAWEKALMVQRGAVLRGSDRTYTVEEAPPELLRWRRL